MQTTLLLATTALCAATPQEGYRTMGFVPHVVTHGGVLERGDAKFPAQLPPFYTQYTLASSNAASSNPFGIPILGSARVPAASLHKTRSTIAHVLGSLPEAVFHKLIEANVRIAIKARGELWTDHPEFGAPAMKNSFDGVVGQSAGFVGKPTIGIVDEGVCYTGNDAYLGRYVVIEEFARAIQLVGIDSLETLSNCFEASACAAVASQRYNVEQDAGSKCASDLECITPSFFAAAADVWFGMPNGVDFRDADGVTHLTPARTTFTSRAQMKAQDLHLAKLMRTVFEDDDWAPCAGFTGGTCSGGTCGGVVSTAVSRGEPLPAAPPASCSSDFDRSTCLQEYAKCECAEAAASEKTVTVLLQARQFMDLQMVSPGTKTVVQRKLCSMYERFMPMTAKCQQKCSNGYSKSLMQHATDRAMCSTFCSEAECDDSVITWGPKGTEEPSPYPVDCVVDLWTEWSPCSKSCLGGTQFRTRIGVLVAPEFGGRACPPMSEKKTCNPFACQQPCRIGQFRDVFDPSKQGMCVNCAPGHFKDVVGSAHTVCQLCAGCDAGFGRIGCGDTQGPGQCTACPAGQFKGVHSKQCTKCRAGQTSVRGALQCTSCAEGAVAVAGAPDCKTCLPGHFAKDGEFCTLCPQGSFATAHGATSCTKCVHGTFGLPYDKDTAHSTRRTDHCVACPPSHYSAAGSPRCKGCGKDKWTAGLSGQWKCLKKMRASVLRPFSGEYSKCTKACGGGEQQRTTIIVSKGMCGTRADGSEECPPGETCDANGENCYQPLRDTRRCNSTPCAVHCKMSAWGQFGACSGSCANDVRAPTRSRSRSVTVAALWGGNKCPPTTESRPCNTQCCRGFWAHSATLCSKCPAGQITSKASPQRPSGCELCAAGHYQRHAAMGSCDRCVAGTTSSSGAASCTACAAGRFEQALTSCVKCPPGRFQAKSGQSVCEACASGRFGNDDIASSVRTHCSVCPGGKFASSPKDAGCAACVAGQFGKHGACRACPVGKFQEFTGKDGCVSCVAGRFGSDNAAAHTKAHCVSCPSGQFGGVGSTCKHCARGFWTSNMAGQTSCTLRPVSCKMSVFGEFSPCTKTCGAGKKMRFRMIIDNAVGTGTPCGSISQEVGCNETPCPVDCAVTQWGAWGTCASKSCESGFFPTVTRTRTLQNLSILGGKSCPAVLAERKCKTKCCPGHYATAAGCLPCSAGTFQQHHSHDTQCKTCGVGRFAEKRGSVTCDACEPGTMAKANAKHTSKAEHCVKCAAGTFQQNEGALECTKCPAGRYVLEDGSDEASDCSPCAPGNFAPTTGSTLCSRCPAGTWQDLWGNAKCVDCAAGRASTATEQSYSDTCKPCQWGEFSATGSATCSACPAGKWQPNEEKGLCLECAAGQYGLFAGQHKTNCRACASGQYQEQTGQPKCTECAAGHVNGAEGGASLLACSKCLAGTFAAAAGGSSCESCPAGQFGDAIAQATGNSCKACPIGTSSKAGAQSCHSCATGTFQDVAGGGACKRCPAGTYGTGTASTSADVCVRCSAGRSQGVAGKKACEKCAAGQFQTSIGQTFCELCSAGRFGARVGESKASACKDCAKGHFQESLGQQSCDKCPVNRYGYTVGATSERLGCDDCPSGKFAKDQGQDECSSCLIKPAVRRLGTAWNPAASCIGCPKGKFQQADGVEKCVTCPKNTWSPHAGSAQCRPCKSAGMGREMWTQGDAGWSKPCVPKPVDCVPGTWGAWSACSKTCSPSWAPGVVTRPRAVLVEGWGGGKACSSTGIDHTSWKQNTVWHPKSKTWVQTKTCPTSSCGGDCQVRQWGGWSICTKSCGGGKAWRKRSVDSFQQPGGQACPVLAESRACNPTACWEALPVCHQAHAGCTVDPQRGVRAVHTRDRAGFNAGGSFTCKRSGGVCECRCSAQKGCCSRAGAILNNTPLVGNTLTAVATKAQCCNLCTTRPGCGSWQWGTDKVCKLMVGSPRYLSVDEQHALGMFQSGVKHFSGPSTKSGEGCYQNI